MFCANVTNPGFLNVADCHDTHDGWGVLGLMSAQKSAQTLTHAGPHQ